MSISCFLECRERYLELESSISSLHARPKDKVSDVFFNHLIYKCRKLQNQMLFLTRRPDADLTVYALQKSIDKVYGKILDFFSSPGATQTAAAGDLGFLLMRNKGFYGTDERQGMQLLELENCSHFETDSDGLYTLEDDRLFFREFKRFRRDQITPLLADPVLKHSQVSFFHTRQPWFFLQGTGPTAAGHQIHVHCLGRFLGTIDVSKKRDVKEMRCDGIYLHVRTSKHWQIWNLSGQDALQKIKEYRVSKKADKKIAHFFQALLLGEEGFYRVGGVKIAFKDIKSPFTFEGAGVISDLVMRCQKNRLFRLLSLAPLHVLVHETGHLLSDRYFTQKDSQTIKIYTTTIGGRTFYCDSDEPLPSWQHSITDAAGPLLQMAFSSAQLVAAAAMSDYLPRPVTLLLEAGAIVHMTGELLYAGLSVMKSKDGDFGDIAKRSKVHLAVATAGLVGTCALGFFGAFQLGSNPFF